MKWSRVPLTLLTPLILSNVLAVVGPTPLAAGPRHGSFSFGVHGPRFGFGFGYRYRPYSYRRPYVRLGSPYPYCHRPVYARAYPLPTYAPYQGYTGTDRALFEPS